MGRRILLVALTTLLAGPAGGGEGDPVVGKPAEPWQVSEWADGKATTLKDLRGRVVVVRFWTNTCPFCAKSLPALETLKTELQGRPVTFVGLYHSKPFGSERPWKDAVAMATRWGVTFPIGYDRAWKTVKSWWLERGPGRRATSASFVIDAEGKVAFVHPGPVFHPSDDPREARQDRDYKAIRAAILTAVEAAEAAEEAKEAKEGD